MIKKWMNKAGACLLACMMMLAVMPTIGVHAATASATVDDVTISGTVGQKWTGMELYNMGQIKIKLQNDTFSKDIDYKSDVLKNMVTNIPVGITVSGVSNVKKDATEIILAVTGGTPTKASSAPLEITIPGSVLTGGNDITVTPNPNAKWNIKNANASATVEDVSINGTVGVKMPNEQQFKITLVNDEIQTTLYANDIRIQSMVTNAPSGIVITSATAAINGGAKSFALKTVDNTPLGASSAPLEITIPGSILKGGKDIKVTPNPNAKWNIVKASSATMSNVTVSGKVNEEIKTQFVTIILSGEELSGDKKTPIITNLPAGLKVDYTSLIGVSKLELRIFGTPTAAGKGFLSITLPGTWLKSGKDMMVTVNPNAKFDIASDKEPTKPAITVGAGSIHQLGAGKDMTFTCSGALEDLSGVYVDGKDIKASNYIVKSGSTILILKGSFLDTLALGKHTLELKYTGNLSASTEFTVAEKETTPPADNKKPDTPTKDTPSKDTPSKDTPAKDTPAKDTLAKDTPVKETTTPNTGDTTDMMVLISLLGLSGVAIAFVSYKRKRRYN